MSHDHHHDKKAKKLAQLLKNKHQQVINAMADQLALGRDLEKEEEEKRKRLALAAGGKSKSVAEKHPVDAVAWSARMQQVRDRNTGRLRMADERWNRFAGTENGGGRGL